MRRWEGFPLADLEEMRDILFLQLDKGYQAIEVKQERGEDTSEYEGFWNTLKDQYDTVTEEIRRKLGEIPS